MVVAISKWELETHSTEINDLSFSLELIVKRSFLSKFKKFFFAFIHYIILFLLFLLRRSRSDIKWLEDEPQRM